MSAHGITRAAQRADRLPRRRAVNRLMEALAALSALLAIALLSLLVYSVARRGAAQLDLDLLTEGPAGAFSFTPTASGFANAFAGSLVLVVLATAMALPVGILTALYLTEFFNSTVDRAAYVSGSVPDGLPIERVAVSRSGALELSPGNPLRADYVYTQPGVELAGHRLGEGTAARLVLWRVGGPVRVVGAASNAELRRSVCS